MPGAQRPYAAYPPRESFAEYIPLARSVRVFHHVRPDPNELAYDLGFLAWEAIMLVAGLLLGRYGDRETAAATSGGVQGNPQERA
ncbi:MAG TPA: DUF2243 domain-containing protein [Rubrobacteraceae bacterium]|nr:DUF2243 domain-containing protein [Rubrobacteraceae bacterium]